MADPSFASVARLLRTGLFREPEEDPGARDLPRRAAHLAEPAIAEETGVGVATARVALASYRLLQHDFPQLRASWLVPRHPELQTLGTAGLERAIERIIDDWLLRNAAFVSARQAGQTTVNTPIRTTSARPILFRPPAYGRALIASVRQCRRALPEALARRWADEPDGLLDLKGAGVAPGVTPALALYGDGLMPLGDALANVAYREVIDLIFRRAGTSFQTVPEYAVLDLGFDVLHRSGARLPAGMQVRRAHRRAAGGSDVAVRGSAEEIAKLEIELLLRHYGLTSCTDGTVIEIRPRSCGGVDLLYGRTPMTAATPEQLATLLRQAGFRGAPMRFEGVNIQLTRDVGGALEGARHRDGARATLVDFGQYTVRPRFDLPLLSLVEGRLLRFGRAIHPGSDLFVQPSPRLLLPCEHWGPSGIAEDQGAAPPLRQWRWPRPHLLGFNLAADFRAGRTDAAGVRARLTELLATAPEAWERAS